ncbi:MAG TPA: GTPase HflX [Streptosporangiaceae bacterium]
MTALTDHRTAVHSTYPDEPEMTFPAERTPPADESARPGEPGRADERPGARVVAVTGDHHAADTGELNLLDRQALRRVAGLSTELEDVTEVEYRALRLERVILVGVWTEGTLANAENSLRELSRLAETAGSVVLDGLVQRRGRPDPATYIGSGKAAEIASLVTSLAADTVICDGELSPSQLRRLEGVVKVKVIDRTALILDIFAQHARSKEGKAQVELAQLEYLLPRLRGWGESLSRQAGGRVAGGGGIGTRGPGETKIETDRRRIRTRTAKLRRQLAEMSVGRKVQRRQRSRREVPAVAIAGYTNAGKSSLLNRLTGAGVLVDDSLFATLDPAVRRARTPSGRWFTLTDTVGFVRHLPHQLVEAFRSTLEEVAESDLIVHVVDGSDADPQAQIAAVREVLGEIGAGRVRELVVINKADAADPIEVEGLRLKERGSVVVSARTGAGLADLVAAIEAALPQRDREVTAVVPYGRGDLVARAHSEGEVLAVRHGQDGTELIARLPPDLAAEIDGISVPS